MADLYKLKRELLKQKRELRKRVMGRDSSESAALRVYGEATKTKKAIKIAMFGDKTKKSATKGGETSIEKIFKDFLIANNIEYKEQKNIRYLNYDFYLPKYNLYVEIQGSYWHCDPRIYTKGPKNKIQRIEVEKNKTKIRIAEESKVNLLCLWQPDLEKYFDIVEKECFSLFEALEKEKELKFRLFSSIDWTKEVFDPKGY